MEKPPPTTVDLPPGFRFHPTDEEIIIYYLTQKIINSAFTAAAIGEADFNKSEPWDLPQKAKMGEKEWYFFCQRDRKYPTGMRTNRATQTGYWKATGKDKEIFKGKTVLAGMKKTLVFYKGRAPKGEKTNWVMHEFRLEPKFSHQLRLPNPAKSEWVVCRVFHKNATLTSTMKNVQTCDLSSCLPPLMDLSATRFSSSGKFNNSGVKWKSSPGQSEYDLKYMSNGANSNHYQQLMTSGATTMIPKLNSYPTSAFDDGVFSFNQLPETIPTTTTLPMDCKTEQVSWSMINGPMQDLSSSLDNDSFAASIVDLDLWDY